jgi:hypothetical protein
LMRLVDEPKSCAISAQFILFEVLKKFFSRKIKIFFPKNAQGYN